MRIPREMKLALTAVFREPIYVLSTNICGRLRLRSTISKTRHSEFMLDDCRHNRTARCCGKLLQLRRMSVALILTMPLVALLSGLSKTQFRSGIRHKVTPDLPGSRSHIAGENSN